MKKVNKFTAAMAVAFLGSALAFDAQADVIELSLVVDASGSIDDDDFELQIDAYENVFSSGSFFDLFLLPGDQLYVNLILFGQDVAEEILFTLIDSNASAAAFGALVGAVDRDDIDETATNTFAATNLAVETIQNNGIDGDRQIIDVSTDGNPNFDDFTPGSAASNAIIAAGNALTAGINVNAIGVGDRIGTTFLTDYTTAGGGFFVLADNFAQFESTLVTKLKRELQQVPEPGTGLLFALGLGLLVAGRVSGKKAA